MAPEEMKKPRDGADCREMKGEPRGPGGRDSPYGEVAAAESPWAQESESCSVVSDSLQPHGLHSPWNSPGQITGVGSLSLLQRIFPTQVSCIAGTFFTSWATREAQEYWSG